MQAGFGADDPARQATPPPLAPPLPPGPVFEQRCRSSVAGGEHLPADGSGRRHFALIDRPRGLVHRFPRGAEDAAGIEVLADRHRAIRGIPGPLLLDVVPGQPGRAHLVLSHVPGRGLDDPAVRAHTGSRWFVEQLVGILGALRDFSPADWPDPPAPTASIQADLLARTDLLRGHIPNDSHRSMVARCRRACDAAQEARVGLVHTDMGGVNLRVAPGRIGLIDWDSAWIADVAADVGAVLAAVPDSTSEAILALDPSLAQDEARCHAYVGSWFAQGALWAIERDDHAALGRLVAQEASWVPGRR